MQRIRTSNLVPGMISAEDVYSYNNQLILPKGSELNDKLITRLEFYSILAIQVEDEIPNKSGSDPSNELESIVNSLGDSFSVKEEIVDFSSVSATNENSTYSEKIKATTQFKEFKKSFISNSEALQGNLNAIVKSNAPIDTTHMLTSVTDLISEGSTSISIFDMLHNMRGYDDLTYVHSMSVSLICNIFGKWLNLNDEDIKVLTIAGLLHDIGKLLIPDSILKKPSKLTDKEYNIIKTHTLQGYNILKDKNIDNRIKNAALLHHERYDGSGYPLGYSGNKLDLFTKIVSIADVYDAMTAARVYRGPLCPFKVIAIFEAEGLQKYDSQLILTFLGHITDTYLNNRVRLNDGTQGDVVMINRDLLSKPMIKTLDNRFINLKEHPELFIEELI